MTIEKDKMLAGAPYDARDAVLVAERLRVGNDVWIGGGVIVCPGVTIGDSAAIGAGSVVTGDIAAGVIAVANPCKVLRSI